MDGSGTAAAMVCVAYKFPLKPAKTPDRDSLRYSAPRTTLSYVTDSVAYSAGIGSPGAGMVANAVSLNKPISVADDAIAKEVIPLSVRRYDVLPVTEESSKLLDGVRNPEEEPTPSKLDSARTLKLLINVLKLVSLSDAASADTLKPSVK